MRKSKRHPSDHGPLVGSYLVAPPRHAGGRIGCTLSILLLFAAPLGALDPEKPIHQFVHRYWRDELPQASVHSILQTRDGYLWLGTYEGLVRFDGARFLVFGSSDHNELAGSSVFHLRIDDDDRLWISTNGGLTSLVDGVFSTRTAADGLPSSFVLATEDAGNGAQWVATDRGLARLEPDGTITSFLHLDLPPPVRGLLRDREGSLWIATEHGIARLTGDDLVHFTAEDGLPRSSGCSFTETADGAVWIASTGGLVRYQDKKFLALSVEDGLPDNLVRVTFEDRDSNLWVGTERSGLSRVSDHGIETFSSSQGLSNDVVRSIFEDREGNLWVGTNGGIDQLRNGNLTTVTTADGLSHDFVRTVFQDRDDVLWVGTQGGGLNRYEDGVWRALTAADGLSNNIVLSLQQDTKGDLWIGTRVGLNRLRDGRLEVFTTKDGLPNDAIRALYADRAGGLWIGTEGGGLVHRIGEEMHYFTTADGLAGNDVGVIQEDRTGRIWVGTFGGLSVIDEGTIHSYTTADGLANDQVLELYIDNEDLLWIATDQGLNLFRNGRFTRFTTANGLHDNKAFRLLEDDGNFWMSSNRGISMVPREHLIAIADGRRTEVHARVFNRADGMKVNQCNGASWPAGWRTSDGDLFFPTAGGLVRLDPDKLSINQIPPPVLVEAVSADGFSIDNDKPARLAPGTANIEIHYTALSFAVPERVRFRYRLEGFDRDWIDAGSRRVAYYTSPPPGDYLFRVVASNEDGIWNEQGATFPFRIPRHWWATPVAYLLFLLSSIGVVMTGIRWRFRLLQNRNRLLESMVGKRTAELDEKIDELERSEQRAIEACQAKSDFLSNMSHELRTPLNSIIGFSHILSKRLKEVVDERDGKFLSNIHRSGEHLLGLINDILDIAKIEAGRMEVTYTSFSVPEALQSWCEVLRGITEERSISLQIEADASIPPLTTDKSKLTQVIINLLSNAIKFSPQGSSVRLVAEHLSATESPLAVDSIQFAVIDQGIGIAKEDLQLVFEAFRQANGGASREYQGTGLGLALAKQLLELIKGAVTVESEFGHGSTFRVYVPTVPPS